MTLAKIFRPYLPHLALICSVVMLGLSFVGVRAIMADNAAPATLGALRYAIAAMAMAPFLLSASKWRLPGRVLIGMILLGGLQFGFFHLFVNTALQEIPASRGAVIFALIPILTMLIAAATGREALTVVKISGALLAFAGVALAIGEKAFAVAQPGGWNGAGDWTGELLFFLAVSCGATYNALSHRMLRDHAFIPLTAVAMAAGAMVLAPFAFLEQPVSVVAAYDWGDWLWLGYLAVPAGALGFFLFNYGLRNSSPAKASIWVPLSPISAAFFGALLLDEHLSGLFLVGLACAVCGPLVVNWRGKTG
jgi:drug/metabolite transporter (DMT)-like permease